MPNSTSLRSRLLLSCVLAACVALTGACKFGSSGDNLRTTIVLVDQSGSIKPADRAIYLQSLKAVGESLVGDDRLLVAPVNATSRSEFVAALDVTVPKSGIHLEYESHLAEVQGVVDKALSTLLPEAENGEANMTRLVETIAAASEALGLHPKEGDRLIMLTDGVEDSPIVDLDEAATNPAAVAKALDKARTLGMLPNLSGVEISVVGAGGQDFAAIQNFRKAYATATGATLAQYGRLPFRIES
jgi:hypothetical protein